MAAAKIQQEHISWLDNSFISTAVKPVDKPHTVKRSHCSSLSNARGKTAKLKCITEKGCINNLTVDSFPQEFDVKSKEKVARNVKGKITSSSGDKKQNMKAIQQHYSPDSSVVFDDDVPSFSRQDQSTALLVFISRHYYAATTVTWC